ncbi:dimethylsulfoxide reductase subunit B, partial [Salmonella enterica subsp. enterica serovar Kentucky]|nr:dimethylsulfoxide reductase subunit B [Salmonella enterica subsp. enterica serovar Kentucky]
MTTQYGFFIDSSRCTGCKTCELACKDYKDLTPDVSFRRIYEYAGGDWQEDNGVWHQNVFAYYLSISCNHCEDPACTKVCPSGAMHKRDDGFVVVNEEVCIGCRYCHMACPYGAPQYNAAKGHMTKCDGCYDRVAEGKKPICVESCPLRALAIKKAMSDDDAKQDKTSQDADFTAKSIADKQGEAKKEDAKSQD